ncbi:MAG: hypothetical protein WDM76_05205 [Limisphaerales bacterium]
MEADKSIVSTRKGEIIYLHILRGQNDTIELPDIARKINSATMLGGGKIEFIQQNENSL